MKNGVLQNWGLVEFFDHNDAERTQQEIDGYNLKGSNIRVLYCIPGVNAINIYMSLVTSADTVSKKGLVDEVPSSTVYAQLQKLGTQNPACKYIFSFLLNQFNNSGLGFLYRFTSAKNKPVPKSRLLMLYVMVI